MFNPQWQQIGGISNATSIRALEGAGSLFDKALGNIQNIVDARSMAETTPLLQAMQSVQSTEELDNLLSGAASNGWANQQALTEAAGIKRNALTQAMIAAEQQKYQRGQDAFKNQLDLSNHELNIQKQSDLQNHRGVQNQIEYDKINAADRRAAASRATTLEAARIRNANNGGFSKMLKELEAKQTLEGLAYTAANPEDSFPTADRSLSSNEARTALTEGAMQEGHPFMTLTGQSASVDITRKGVQERFNTERQMVLQNLREQRARSMSPDQLEALGGDLSSIPLNPKVVDAAMAPVNKREKEALSTIETAAKELGFDDDTTAETRGKALESMDSYLLVAGNQRGSSGLEAASGVADQVMSLPVSNADKERLFKTLKSVAGTGYINDDYSKALPVLKATLESNVANPYVANALIKNMENKVKGHKKGLNFGNATAADFAGVLTDFNSAVSNISKDNAWAAEKLIKLDKEQEKLPANKRLSDSEMIAAVMQEQKSMSFKSKQNNRSIEASEVADLWRILKAASE